MFVGRDREIARLEEKLGLAVEGKGQVVAVSGEAGIGKTRLLSELTERGSANGINVYLGRCREMALSV